MMINITVYSQGKKDEIEVARNSNLLTELFKAGFKLYSPCGGNGTCGKCKVYLKEEGYITACLFNIEKDIEVILPDPSEAEILVSQYRYTRKLPFSPGKTVGLSAYPLGVAIDIGTTTVVLYLVNLITGSLIESRAFMNPQEKYGADVISRINYCIQNPDGLKKMQSEILGLINDQISSLADSAGVSGKEVVKLTISGNTTMLHLFLGTDPTSLAFVPFKAVFLEQKMLKASEAGLLCLPDAEVILLPSISAYIGADIACGLASLADRPEIRNYLFIDIGTNGEMALVKGNKIYACATAAGPAFEGANISCGMPALEGAISSFKAGKYKTVGNAPASGICGSGLIDIVAYLFESGRISSDGVLKEEFLLNEETKNENVKIVITQNDIREIQLAKSAIMSGIKILFRNAGMTLDQIGALYLAGGFGNYINISNAVTIGLLPFEIRDKVIPVGNSSGTGAILALKAESFYQVLKHTVEKTTVIELSEDEDFAMEFAMNMEFPVRER